MFTGRAKEMEALNGFYEKAKERVACIYGRTGIGKTTLLREFSKDKKTIFFTAYATTEKAELEILASAIDQAKGTGNTIPTDSIQRVLDEISDIGKKEPILFIIDHYPNFVKAGNGYDKELFSYVTEKWNRLPIKVILCGDSYLSMEKQVYGKKAMWKDTLSLIMEVSPMDFYESKAFFGNATNEQSLFLYGMTGGIPYALSKVSEDVDESVSTIFLGREGDATLLPEKTMSIELRELSYYNRMLTTLASGKLRVNQISQEVGKPKDIVVPYMNTLMSIGVVKKENPVTEKTNRKKTRYSIINTFDLFWYRYVVTNMPLYYAGDKEKMLEVINGEEIDYFKQIVFTKMCKEYLVHESGKDSLPFTVDEIGNWWENDEEKHTSEGFDLVALGKNGEKDAIIFARCYYTDSPVEISTLKELIDLTKHMKQKGDQDIFYLIFSSSGFNENTQTVASTIRNIMLISLDDVCK